MINRVRVLALANALVWSACASIVSGPRQSVKIDSVPQGARVFTAVLASGRNGGLRRRTEVGVTPMTVSITRKDGVVELEKEGYQLTRVPMKRNLNPWFFGNVVMTSMVSSSIDSSTGAINEYDPDQYLVELPVVDTTAWPSVGRPGGPPEESKAPNEAEEPWVPDVRPLAAPPPAASPD